MTDLNGAKIKLHWLNGSRAQGILWLLEELKVPYEIQIYHRQANKLAPPELRKVHPLGKSPVVTIEFPGAEPLVLAETGFIVQYFSEHFTEATNLVPKRWKNGQEGKLGGETDEWMRYQYIMYYSEGSFMPTTVLQFILSGLRGPAIPFFIRPLTGMFANQLGNVLVVPNMKKHFGLLESFFTGGAKYFCGEHLTGADFTLAYALIGGKEAGLLNNIKWDKATFAETYPLVDAYIDRLAKEPGWLRSIEKIKEIEGSYSPMP